MIDRHVAPVRRSIQFRGIPTTRPSSLLCNSIGLSKVGVALPTFPWVIDADTAAHCRATFVGEFARSLTMTDVVTGWTENSSTRKNASAWIVGVVAIAVALLQSRFPFPLVVFDSDTGLKSINQNVADWRQQRDIAQTRSRPYKENDHATAESKNHHVVRKHAVHWRYDTPEAMNTRRYLDMAFLDAVDCKQPNIRKPTRSPCVRHQIASRAHFSMWHLGHVRQR